MAENARLGVRRAGSIFQFNANSQYSIGRVEGTSKVLELCSGRCLVPSKEYEMPCQHLDRSWGNLVFWNYDLEDQYIDTLWDVHQGMRYVEGCAWLRLTSACMA